MLLSPANPMILIVDKNTSAADFARLLKSKQLISVERLFLLLIRLEGGSHRLKAGVYQVVPGETAQQLLYKVIAGEVLVNPFKIIEGTTLKQVMSNLENAPYLLYNTADWQPIQGDYPSPEGLLLADTYSYNAGSGAKHLLKNANEGLLRFLSYTWSSRNPELPYKTSYELLIAASIVEKEAALLNERKIIAGIIVNRLKRGMPLQMDPTVVYALGDRYTGKLKHEDIEVNSPYNTYRHRGLPPTPIAMVGKEAIEAAAHPQISNYLYFVAKGDGTHYFSATYEEQKKAILLYHSKGSL